MTIADPRSTRRKGCGVTARDLVCTRITVFTATALVVLPASLLVTLPAQAARGDLDTTFGGDGKQTTDFGVNDSASGISLTRTPGAGPRSAHLKGGVS